MKVLLSLLWSEWEKCWIIGRKENENSEQLQLWGPLATDTLSSVSEQADSLISTDLSAGEAASSRRVIVNLNAQEPRNKNNKVFDFHSSH